jgi:hypothetical protein
MRHKPFTAYETFNVDMSSITAVVNLLPKVRSLAPDGLMDHGSV